MAGGAEGVETACRTRLGRLDGLVRAQALDHLVRAQAPGADAQALDAAVDERAHLLQVGLEPARCHIVRVTDVAAHDRALSADFTAFCHLILVEAAGRGRDKHRIIARQPGSGTCTRFAKVRA